MDNRGAGNSNIVGRCRSQWRGVECNFLDDDGIIIAKVWVITCDPMEFLMISLVNIMLGCVFSIVLILC